MAKSTRRSAGSKPAKPHPDFPLYAHASKRWAKRVKGRIEYFGPWNDPQAALAKWLEQKDDLLAGRRPRSKAGALSLADLCNHFLAQKDQLVQSGELAPRTFERYKKTAVFLLEALGRTVPAEDLRPADFEALRAKMAQRWGPVALGYEIQAVRSIFKYGAESELLSKVVKFGPGFKKPSAKTLRKNKAAAGPRMFAPGQIHALLKAAGPNMKAMILLGLNAGLGNTNLGCLPIAAVNLESGWLDYPREKTAVPRRIPLWQETTQAIRDALAARKQPKDPDEDRLLFIGAHGESYVGNHRGYRVAQEFNHVAGKGKVEGRSFYDLRRTFQTVAEGARDLVAVQSIMGHAPASSDMSSIYRQRVEDDRLLAVVNHVRNWLFSGVESK